MTLSRRRLLVFAGATGAATLLGSGAPAAAAPRFPGDPGPGRLYYGSTTPHYSSLARWESWLGRPLASRRHYHQAHQIRDLVDEASRDLRRRRMPHASVKPPGTWQSVARGVHDVWLGRLLDGVAGLGGPVLLTLHHEPENDVGGAQMQPLDWVAMQERAIAMAAVRAPRVTITPVLMSWTFQSRKRRPGDWVVPSAKVFGFDVYNSWSRTNGLRWTSFAEDIRRVRPWADGKPLVIGEYGCRHDPAHPERAVRWMRAAVRCALNNDVVCMSYFNSRHHSPDGSWELHGRRARVFRTLLGRRAVARP